ncbi:receptor for retinol uptake STRA6 [Cyanistes caeruleus]|uniref:receptor for retinol uptake STRA6 n=1 Tax=Cyanistes caeruleus TaxID=156563 RepID=UPI000CDB3B40|nr:receptor for retinol uptake STRA6 [Cyanistes caeruleus]
MASNGSSGIRDSPLETGIFLDEDLGSDWYLYESTESALGDDLLPDAIPECHPTISPRLYHTIMAPVSLAVILALSFPAKRRRLHRSCWSGVPGLLRYRNSQNPTPPSLERARNSQNSSSSSVERAQNSQNSGNLEEDGSRAPAAAAFALQISALFQLLLDREPLPLAAPAGHGAREFWKLLALLYYPALYWPLLACAAARRRRGYAAGALLAWGHCGAQLGQRLQCPLRPQVHGLYSALCHVPALLALALLSLWYPALLIRSLRQRPEPQQIPRFRVPFPGLLIQQVIFFLCSVAFAFLVVIPLQAGHGSPLLGILRNVWPLWLFLFLAVLLQHLLAHFHFLQRNSLSAELAHRCTLSVTSFLLFPTNVLVGLVAGVWRVVISGLYNSVHFCRLDISLLHRRADTFDPGYHSYCHYLRVEVSQCHPLLKAFCFLLLQPCRPEPPRDTQLEEGLQLMHPKHPALGKARIRQIRARWCLAYTLLHNPSLSASRKTALANPAANGAQLGVPRP